MAATLRIAYSVDTQRRESKEEKYKRMVDEIKDQLGYDSNRIHKECRKCYRGGNDRCFKLHPKLQRFSPYNKHQHSHQQQEEPVASGSIPSTRAVTRASNIGFQNRSVFSSSNRLSNINPQATSINAIGKALSQGRITSNSIIDDSSNVGHTFNDLR